MLHRALRAIPLAIDYDPIVASQLSQAPETSIYVLYLVILVVKGWRRLSVIPEYFMLAYLVVCLCCGKLKDSTLHLAAIGA